MKTFPVRTAVLIAVLVSIVACCKEKNQFTVEGTVTGAKDKVMYLEHLDYDKVTVIDSVKLTEKGSFQWHKPRPAAPDFYQLRLNGQRINFSVDSTETIVINASVVNFAKGYTIEGSQESAKIKEFTLLQMETSDKFNKLQQSFKSGEIAEDQYQQQIKELVAQYKDSAKKEIFQNPRSSSAYFALFQQVNNLLIFDPYDKDDYKAFGAVATSWNQFYPEIDRTKHIYNLTLQALKVIRSNRPMEVNVDNIATYFDFTLPGIKGDSLKFSEHIKDKVILLDFTAYQTENSVAHNMQLGSVYEKNKDKGFEIFQVSLDSDEHLWKNAAVNLPWICVRDPQSIYSEIAGMYNVKEIPTGFLLNKKGEIVKRIDSTNELENEIRQYLN